MRYYWYYWISSAWDHPSYENFQVAMRDAWNQLPRQILSVYRRCFVKCCWSGRCIHSKGLSISENKPLGIFWEGCQNKNWVAHISNRATSSSSLVVDGNTWGHILTSFIPGRGFIMFHRFSRIRAVNPHFFGRFPAPLWEPHRCPACRAARWKLRKLPGDDELPESWRWRTIDTTFNKII